jgi:hypothetical protein
MRTLMLIATLLACGSSTAPGQSTRRLNARQGFWIGFGVGGGSAKFDCASCIDEFYTVGSGYVRLGGTLSHSLLIGVESSGWAYSRGGSSHELIAFGLFDVLWYPSATGALYVKFGLGGMTYRAKDQGVDVLTATAPSASVGLGYEVRVGRDVSLVPYVNGLASSTVRERVGGVPSDEDIRIKLFQFGLGVTCH